MLIPFSPPPGLNSDDTTFSAEGRWADGNNVRFRNGRPQVIGGWLDAGLGAGAPTDKIVSIGVARDSVGAEWLITGCDDALYYGQGIQTAVITPVGLGSGIARWAIQPFGSIALMAPGGGTLYEKALTGVGVATEVANAPDNMTWMLVTPQRQVLAFGCNEETSGTRNHMCIRGSDLEDYTDWTTSSSNNAFEHILEGQGKIVRARMVGTYVAVWTDVALYLGEFIGDPGQTYRFDRVDTNCGLVAADACTVLGGYAYWLTPDFRLYRWTPGTLPEAVPCPIGEDFRDNFSKTQVAANTMVRAVPHYDEVWIHYSDSRDANASSRATRYIAVNVKDGSWFRGQMQLSAIADGRVTTITTSRDVGAYLTADGTTMYIQGHGNTANGSAMSWHIQSADFYLNESAKRMMIRGIIPDFEDQVGDVTLTLYTRDRPQSSAVTKGPYTLTTATTKKDFRASGKVMAVKFSGGDASGSYVRLGKQLFDAVPMGDR